MGSKAYTSTTTADLRTAVESTGGGKMIGPQAISADPGSLALGVGDFSNVNLSGKFRVGMSGQEVKSLLAQQTGLAEAAVNRVADFGTAAISSTMSGIQAARAQELTAGTGELPNWQRFIPLGIIAAVALAAWRHGKG